MDSGYEDSVNWVSPRRSPLPAIRFPLSASLDIEASPLNTSGEHFRETRMPRAELDLLQGTLDVLVLKALSWGPRHGHAVAQLIRTSTNGTLQVLDGSLYTALHRLEERGWIESEWGHSDKGKRAKFYTLTTARSEER